MLGLSPLEQKKQIVLDIHLKPCYNTPMKEKTFTIMNPLSAQPILEGVEASRLNFFLSYFRELTGIWDLPVIEETA